MSFQPLPYEDSTYAAPVDTIFVLLTTLCSVITLAIFAVIIIFCIRYRRGSSADRTPGPPKKEQKIMEYSWTIIPLVLFLFLFVWAADVYYDMFSPPADGIPIYVIGKQWMWKMEHPEGEREIDQLHIPVDRQIILTLTSQDVIHDFDVPAFRIKHDVLPGRYVRMWFKATKVGTYHLFCGQYCGALHSQMIGQVIVMTAADYAKWLDEAGATTSGSLAGEGSRYFHELGCSGCHENSKVVQAPSLAGIYGEPVPLESGQMVTADDDYLRDSILLPGKQIARGFQNIMPSYQGLVSEEQIVALIAYIRSERNTPAPAAGSTP
jgi:cytochrome c oxidase subunit II